MTYEREYICPFCEIIMYAKTFNEPVYCLLCGAECKQAEEQLIVEDKNG